MVKRLFACLMTFVIAVIVFQLAWGAEVRKVTQEDIEWGDPSTTVTSAGGHVGHKIDNTFKLSSPWVDVRVYGAALTIAVIQLAINSLDNTTGGEVFIPAGHYDGSAALEILDKNNVILRGAGKGKTVLDFSGQANLTYSLASRNFGPITVDSTAYPHTALSNITIRDLTVKSSTSAPSSSFQKSNIFFGSVAGFNVINVELDGGYYEGLYTESSPSKVRIRDCDIKNAANQNNTGSIDFNTVTATDVIIDGNTFDNVYIGIAALGNRIVITNNMFKDIVSKGIEYGESNGVATNSLSGAIISNNIFMGLGKNALAGGSYGIYVATTGQLYTDNTMDIANIISNNVFLNAYTDYAVVDILTNGPIKVYGNYAAGLRTGANAYNTFFQYDGTGAGITNIHLTNNTLQSTLASKNYDYGVSISKTDNVYVYMSGNTLTATTAILTTNGTSGSAAYTPFISLGGDILNGIINIGWSATLNDDNTLNNIPIHGSTTSVLKTRTSIGLTRTVFDNTTTPSVAGANLFVTKASTTVSITGFTNSQQGQEITVLCEDNTATFVNSATNFNLSGGANVSCAPYKILKFIRIDLHNAPEWWQISTMTDL